MFREIQEIKVTYIHKISQKHLKSHLKIAQILFDFRTCLV